MSAESISGVDPVTPRPDETQSGSRDRRGAGIWALLAAVLVAGILMLILFTQCVPRVPDVLGLTEKQAIAKLEDTGYKVGTVSKIEVPGTPAGKVAEQAPAAGAVFSRGRTVDLVVALGAGMVEVPDVVGNDTPSAELLITGKQLVMTVDGQYSSTIPAGAVISQNPPARTMVRVGSTVIVVVSLGIEPALDIGFSSTGSSTVPTSGDGGSGSTGSGSPASNCTASYPNGSVWAASGDIYIRLSSGGGTRQLTSGSAWDSNPLLSPNAKYVVFMRAPSSGARRNGIGRVCLTDFGVSMLELPISRPSSASTVYYGPPDFAPSPTGTAPGSDWLVTPQFMTDDPQSAPGVGARLLVTNVPIDSTWASWNYNFRPTNGLRLSRSARNGCVKVTRVGASGAGATLDFNVYTGKYLK